MKKNLSVLLAIIALMFSIACGSVPVAIDNEAQPATTTKMVEIHPELEPVRQPTGEEIAKAKLASIDSAKAEWKRITDTADWTVAVRTSNPICTLLDRYQSLRDFKMRLTYYVGGAHDLAFEDMGLDSKTYVATTKKAGVAFLTELLAEYRKGHSPNCEDGEGPYALFNGWDCISTVFTTMAESKQADGSFLITPADIGLTPEKLRELIRLEAAKAVKAKADGYETAAREAMSEYGFSSAQIGLTEDEAKAVLDADGH